jgi:hypothetical protein
MADTTISNEAIEYSKLLDSKFVNFQKNYNRCCMALTHLDLQCKNRYYTVDNHILCKLHRKKKYKPEFVIVYIDNNDNNTESDSSSNKHIIAYPYKNKEQYYKDIELYKKELKDMYSVNWGKIKEITTCNVCSDTFIHNELIKCSNITCDNKHIICDSCLSGYIDSQISNDIGTYECMFNKTDKCNGVYNSTIFNTILAKYVKNEPDVKDNSYDKLMKWQELVTITDIFKMSNICDNYIICPLCRKWGCILEIDPRNTDPINIQCMNCNLKWCNSCKREEHRGSSCYKLIFKANESEEEQIQLIDTMIINSITKALTHNCSTCGCAYIKEEGCNLMICSHCGGMSCYLCDAKIYYKEGRGKYWHFVGHELSDPDTTCLIWNSTSDDDEEKQGNTDYNNNRIISEFILFIKHNIKKISKIIYNRILVLCEKYNILYIQEIMIELNADDFSFIPEKYRIGHV